MRLVCLGVSHRTASLEVRERLSLGFEEAEDVLAELRDGGHVVEAVWLSTCHRLEAYALVKGAGFALDREDEEKSRQRDLEVRAERVVSGASSRNRGIDRLLALFVRRPGIGARAVVKALYGWEAELAVRHLFRVACGLDSMVVGETEVLGQLKEAYETALRSGHTGRGLNPLFQSAFRAAKHVRSRTGVQKGPVSVASLAAEFAEEALGTLADRQVLVLGAGDTGAKVSRALLDRGAGEVRIANRTEDRGARLVATLGAKARLVPMEPEAWADVDVVVGSVEASGPLWDARQMMGILEARQSRELLVLDLGLPRNFDPRLAEVSGVTVVHLDDLRAQAERHMRMRQAEARRGEALLRESVKAAYRRLDETAW